MSKKICIVDYDMSVWGGVEQVTSVLASALADDYEVHVLSLCMTRQLAYKLDERVHFTYFLDGRKRLRQMRKELIPKIIQYFKHNSIDTAIIQGTYPGFILSSIRLRYKTKTKLIFSDHGALMNQWDSKAIVLIRLLASVICHKVVVLTEQSRDDYIKKFHLKKDRVAAVPNWIDLDEVCPHGYCIDSKRIISAGRFTKEKGFDQLVKAYAIVAKRHPDWQLDICGDGDLRQVIEKLVSEYSLNEKVKLLGMRSDLKELYQKYAMYVLPSYREGMPLVLLEAKANGLPIVSFDVTTGPREIVRNGVDGILAAPKDIEGLADAMCRLIEDSKLRKEMSERSKDNLNKFSKKEILKRWQSLINEV